MSELKFFPEVKPGKFYITEGGVETEIMYKGGYDMPHFAMYPLLEKPDAREAIKGIYRQYLDVVAKYGHSALIGGFDYRASPDWGALLGYSEAALAEANMDCIALLREIAGEYGDEIPEKLITGYLGPRGDAYSLNKTITQAEAEDYHAIQLQTLKKAEVDLVWALTFNNSPEAIGAVKAAQAIGVTIAVSFTLTGDHKLRSGETIGAAIRTVDQATQNGPVFYGLNCSHPIEYEPAMDGGDWIKRVRSIRPNAAKMDKIALCKLGHLEEGDPVELGKLMNDARRRYPHMDVWGGCCGTCETHLEEIVRHLPSPKLRQAS